MRHILIDRARARATLRRGGAGKAVTLEDAAAMVDDRAQLLLEIDDAIDRLAAVAPRLAQVVEYRFYGGLSETEVAEVLGVTLRTVQRDWTKARMLLRVTLES
jgi:RNA polymerase sigma factor (TIGR02999 family)